MRLLITASCLLVATTSAITGDWFAVVAAVGVLSATHCDLMGWLRR